MKFLTLLLIRVQEQNKYRLSWDKPLNLYTDIEVYAKASNEVVFNKVTTITNIDHYTVNDLKEGTQYEFI